MANVIPVAKQQAVMAALVEGASIRSIERMTGVHRDTITRLSVKVGQACEKLLDKALRNLPCRHIQIWCYVGKKQRHLKTDDDPRLVGDFWTFLAFDTDTKLVAAYHVGKRDHVSTNDFVEDLSSSLSGRVELSADAMPAYVDAVKRSFGRKVDFGQIVKHYEAEPTGAGRYSQPKMVRTETRTVIGHPVNVCTSHVERMNLNMRMTIRRFTRLTSAFSNKVGNLRAAVALYLVAYNFVRVHGALRVTPAMEAEITDSVWTIADLVELPEVEGL